MPDSSPDIDKWLPAARALPRADFVLPVPFHVLCGEAIDAAQFHRLYWKDVVEHGVVVRLGLESAVKRGGPDSLLSAATGEEIRSLERAVHELNNRFQLTSGLVPRSPAERGRFVLAEIRAAVEYLLDDGVRDDRDAQLARVEAAHEGDPDGADALALALEDFAGLASLHRERLDGLGGFSVALLDEARAIAEELRLRPPSPNGTTLEARAALELRNRFLLLLTERVAAVRAAARFVFRNEPVIARQATSAYERKRRAAHRRATAAAKTQPVGEVG